MDRINYYFDYLQKLRDGHRQGQSDRLKHDSLDRHLLLSESHKQDSLTAVLSFGTGRVLAKVFLKGLVVVAPSSYFSLLDLMRRFLKYFKRFIII